MEGGATRGGREASGRPTSTARQRRPGQHRHESPLPLDQRIEQATGVTRDPHEGQTPLRRRRLPCLEQYLATVRPSHELFIEPSKRHADVIVPHGGMNAPALDVLLARVRELL